MADLVSIPEKHLGGRSVEAVDDSVASLLQKFAAASGIRWPGDLLDRFPAISPAGGDGVAPMDIVETRMGDSLPPPLATPRHVGGAIARHARSFSLAKVGAR